MKLSDYSIKHPAVITILLIVLLVFGVIAATGLTKDMIAEINIPTLLVITSWPGVGPGDVEADVTDVLEAELGTLEGLNQMTSISRNSISLITLELNFGESAGEKLPDVREKINQVASQLPSDLPGPPRIVQYSTSSCQL